jgi:hypothetical protein
MFNDKDNRFHAWSKDSVNAVVDVDYRTRMLELRYSSKPKEDALQFFSNLPSSILEKIYREYLEPEFLWDEYKRIINLRESQKLSIRHIRPHVPEFLAKPIACEYFSKKCFGWRNSYAAHKVKGKKYFEKMNNGDSFSLSILMYLYH